ncbi:hypothetical protein [Candidatus Leptofilum sp.]|uniref:hypothetical protein n=1 Tax=Candidatus Leptofilum sp. TaxID=3241576 RepID=UPI003B5C40C2
MRKMIWLLLFFVCVTIACNAAPTETAEQVATAVPTNTLQPTEPPPTETPTNTPAPTNTAVPLPTDTPEPTATATPAPTATAVPVIDRFSLDDRFTIYGEEPAVPRGNKQFTDPGAVVFHEGQFHMFHNTFTGWPASVDIAYSTSSDGISWTRVQEEPVLKSNAVPFAGVAALASSALVQEDGTWYLYFYTWDDRTWPKSEGSIGVATATNPLGPWTVVEEPILEAGDDGSWDETAVRSPSVIQTEDGFVMFYAGYGGSSSAIGRATSEDGLSWAKFDDPATEAEPFQSSDPIFSGSGSGWDRSHVFQPHVQQTPDGWVMLYATATNVSNTPIHNRHGIAVSQDGQEWMRSDAPIFLPTQVNPRGNDIWYAEIAYAQGTYFVYVELGRGNNTEVFVATLAEPLLSE